MKPNLVSVMEVDVPEYWDVSYHKAVDDPSVILLDFPASQAAISGGWKPQTFFNLLTVRSV
jgi:hypothetical protein